MRQKFYGYSVFIGILLSIMITLNSALSTYLGNIQGVFIIHVVGLTGIVLFILLKKIKLNTIKGIKPYIMCGGMIGVIMVSLNNVTTSQIGLSLTVACGVLGQMLFSSIVDHYGLFGNDVVRFNSKKILGYAVIVAGLAVMILI